jgi:hypothetical protein
MAFQSYQIDHKLGQKFMPAKPKAGFRKWLKNQRNRKIRRVSEHETPNIKYAGWE